MITWREVADQYRDLMVQLGLQVQQLQEQNAVLTRQLQERDVADVVAQVEAKQQHCEVCGDPRDVGDHEQCDIVSYVSEQPDWDLTKDSEHRKWDHGLEVYNRMSEREPDDDQPVVYSYGPDDKDFEETTYGSLKERYAEFDVRSLQEADGSEGCTTIAGQE